MAGALIVTRPTGELHPGVYAALLSSLLWAGVVMIIRVLSRSQSSIALAGVTLLFVTPFALLIALPVWQWPAGHHWLLLLLAAAFANLGQIATNEALAVGETTLVLPFDYTRLIFASVFGTLFFAELPTLYTLLGGLLICVSSLYIAYREAQLQRRAVVAAPPDPGA
jgi:drug/metabolite transporter (DMT)-like permease